MIRTLDFNTFAAGTVIDNEYEDVTISATGGSGQAMTFDSANPTGGDDDLASDTLGGLLIISEDGDSADPDDNAGGGSIFFVNLWQCLDQFWHARQNLTGQFFVVCDQPNG